MGDADKPRAPETHPVEATLAGGSDLHSAERHFGLRPVEIRGDQWVQIGRGFSGRPPTLDPASVLRWQAELEEHIRDLPSEPMLKDSIRFTVERIGGQAPCDDVVLEQIVRPVHARRWPKLKR
jgi:hypothetical protein